VLDKAVRRIEARGSIDTARRAKQICGQLFRYAVAIGLAERDVTADLRGALAAIPESHFSAITEPKQAGELMRPIFDYTGNPFTVAVLKLSALVFVRPGELRSAEWAELDLNSAEWRITARQRTKLIRPMSIFAVKSYVRASKRDPEIERSRQEWVQSDVHKMRSPGLEILSRVGGESRAMDRWLWRLRW
jgi:integrase